MSLKDFEILSQLGTGSYSTVFKVRRRADSRLYALKQVTLRALTPREKANAVNEIRLLASVFNPHIVSYYDSFVDPISGSLCIVMEYAEGGDLQKRLRQCREMKMKMPEEEIWKVFGGIVQGLCALHELQILHRDIKSANIFLTYPGEAKLGDFNVAKVFQAGLLNTQTGTPYYSSPEVWDDLPYDFQSDIWSLGCVLYEMAALEPPFTAADMDSLYWKVVKGVYTPLPETYSLDLGIMVRNLLQVNPTARPTSKRLLQHLIHSGRLQPTASPPAQLLRTIQFPKKLRDLRRAFPSPKYQTRRHEHNTSLDKETCRHPSMRSVSIKPRERKGISMRESLEEKRPHVFRLPSLKLSRDLPLPL